MTEILYLILMGLNGCASNSEQPEDISVQTDNELTETDTGQPVIEPDSGPLSGSFYLSFIIAPVGNLEVPYQIELTSSTLDGVSTIDTFEIRATDAEGNVSDVLSSLTDLEISEKGTFTAVLGSLTHPGAFSPTGSDVIIDAVLHAQITKDTFCGDITGEVVSFSMDLKGSTFGAVAWEERDGKVPGSCDGFIESLEPIADCPDVVSGMNTQFPSGGDERSFDVILPTNYTPKSAWPVLFAFHGINCDTTQLLDQHGLAQFADSHGVIIVAPQAQDLAGAIAFDAMSSADTNKDLLFFDDMLTCMSETLTLDPDRVWITGMSAGGMMTGMLIARRSGVIAAAAPFSGGINVDDVSNEHNMPVLITWGGITDASHGQDFHTMSTEMIDTLSENGNVMVVCDHQLGHYIEEGYWIWALEFLFDHPLGATTPYTKTLPDVFPSFCTIW